MQTLYLSLLVAEYRELRCRNIASPTRLWAPDRPWLVRPYRVWDVTPRYCGAGALVCSQQCGLRAEGLQSARVPWHATTRYLPISLLNFHRGSSLVPIVNGSRANWATFPFFLFDIHTDWKDSAEIRNQSEKVGCYWRWYKISTGGCPSQFSRVGGSKRPPPLQLKAERNREV